MNMKLTLSKEECFTACVTKYAHLSTKHDHIGTSFYITKNWLVNIQNKVKK